MLALICLSSGKVIWELHFLIVHARVFKNTKVYNVEHVSNQGENLNDETVAFLNELEVTVPALQISSSEIALDSGDQNETGFSID